MSRRSISPFERFSEPTPVEDVLAVEHTIVAGESWSSIAHLHYEDWRLMYLILDRNKIYDPVRDLAPGLRLVIPPRPTERGMLESG